MGVTGLMKALRPLSRDVDVREYRGLAVGVDASAWLHRAYWPAMLRVMGIGPPGRHLWSDSLCGPPHPGLRQMCQPCSHLLPGVMAPSCFQPSKLKA